MTVHGSVADVRLDPGLRDQPWSVEDKRALIARGYELTDQS